MDSGLLFLGGILLCLTALMIVVLVVLPSPNGRIPLGRRRPAGTAATSALSGLTSTAVSAIDRLSGNRPNGPLSQESLDAAGITLRRPDFVLMLSSITTVALLAGILLASPLAAAGIALAVPVGALLLLKVLAGRRRVQFDEHLSDALQMLSGGLRAGHSLLHSLDAVARESDGPMGSECTRVVNEARLGRNVADALAQTARRMRSDDFAWLAQAIDIHRDVGGDLAEVLDHVGDTIRERTQIKRQVRALSAEGRTSAKVLLALPVVMIVLLSLVNPDYVGVLMATPIGFLLLGAGALLLAAGALWLRKLVQVRF